MSSLLNPPLSFSDFTKFPNLSTPTALSDRVSLIRCRKFSSKSISCPKLRSFNWPSHSKPLLYGFTESSEKEDDEKEDNYIVGDFCPLYSSSAYSKMHSTKRRQRSKKLDAIKINQGDVINHAEAKGRIGEIVRVTKETNVQAKINLNGSGISDCNTSIPFLDHMLDQISSHGLFDISVKASGDTHIDDHHTNEDVALAIGSCLLQALGDRKGIYRFGDFSAPLDEALVHVALDLSGRPYLGYGLCIPTERVGTYDTQLVEHFFQSVVNTSGMTLHIRQLAGRNSHHIIEASFKAFARALRQATDYDLRRSGSVPSSKGVLLCN
eukprot:TRINITY_DN27238_c0_g1_i1.p1 TRINITY_DN27238_c0_g1~~TRINITY_DN27238_c0_g1_i1.p1  ORF type:complete len:324 (+),score=54.28 TRINITY_DN27238_c0_g1_i1:102-1073(+)